jgi:hypothetical protein
MGNVIYVDFIQRKPIVDAEQRINLVAGNLEHYGKLCAANIGTLNGFCGVVNYLMKLKGDQ